MTFHAFGLNHLRAPVEVREAFALDEDGKRRLLRNVQLETSSELILLSTCNRTEAFLYGRDQDVGEVTRALCSLAGRHWPEDASFYLQDESAVRHVLEVAGGLKSLVIGDAQIFSQLKDAYRIAVEEQRVGTTMHRLMHTAFRVAKRVVNETALSAGGASIPYVAVQAALSHLRTHEQRAPEDLRVLVVGSGSMGKLAAEALVAHGVRSITLTNRSGCRPDDVFPGSDLHVVDWRDRHVESLRNDVVIVATSAEIPVITTAELQVLEPTGSTFFVDISVPRNVESSVGLLPGMSVIDVDGLSGFLAKSESVRRTAVPDARQIVHEMLCEFVAWVFHHQALQPAIQTIADTFEMIRSQEVERHAPRFSDTDRAELDRITRSIVQKILAVPVVRLKSVEPESIDFVQGIRLLHALFRRQACEEDATRGAVHPVGRVETHIRVDGDELPPEDCPIDPQLSHTAGAETISQKELDDVLRLFSRRARNQT